MQGLFRDALLKSLLPRKLLAYALRRKFVLCGMLLPLTVLLGSRITVLAMPIELGGQAVANTHSSDQTAYNPPSAAGQSQGQSVNPQSTHPIPAAEQKELPKVTPISIGVPVSPEEYRRLKERATHPTDLGEEKGSVDSQAGDVSAGTDESQR
ncbi:hypothetical protein NIES4073_37460 [Kalymmatonema gypsitolerans NIES-4073]|nr:hypothetical protein NIES4073_37460 [Scytonema sp. NIES-4073]